MRKSGDVLEGPTLFDLPPVETKEERFAGADYDPAADDARLTGQIHRVYDVMKSGRWMTLCEIQNEIADRFQVTDPHASISAQLRHLRKSQWGAHVIEKRARGERKSGLYEYRLVKGEA